MNGSPFHSVFSEEMVMFLAHRENSGLKNSGSSLSILKRLDEFIASNCEEKTFTKENADIWLQRRQDESPEGHYRRINFSKLFFQHLFPQGYRVFLFDDIRNPPKTFRPYIYTKEDLQRYFHAVDSYDPASKCAARAGHFI